MNNGESLLNIVKKVLDSELTAYRIAKEVGYSSAHPVHDLRSGKADVNLIRIETAMKFEALYNKLIKLEELK